MTSQYASFVCTSKNRHTIFGLVHDPDKKFSQGKKYTKAKKALEKSGNRLFKSFRIPVATCIVTFAHGGWLEIHKIKKIIK
jgi:hypothetical protein